MKKLIEKDKHFRKTVFKAEKQHFVLKSIFKNSNFFVLIRWNSFIKLKTMQNNSYKTSLLNYCAQTNNRKRFNKLTKFSRYVFLKQLRFGKISGIQKSVW